LDEQDLAALDDFLDFITAARLALAAGRGDFDLLFSNFFVIGVGDVICVRVYIFVGVEIFGFAVFLYIFILFGISGLLLSFFSFEQGKLILMRDLKQGSRGDCRHIQ